ncbi:MAG: hypothetical protein NW214_11660 [Pseudanabaenaceae cyanobacterium bins.39]|nr:hypothetical protein [Pseudanabaenaceae cyanobacterium bins.39]
MLTSISPALTESFALAITEAIQSVYDSLSAFASSADFFEQSEFVFGESLNHDVLSSLQQQWLSRDFSGLPDLKLLSASDLQGANAAFAGSTGEIYLSEGFLSQYVGSPQVLAAVLLEEVGHSVDWKVNAVDTPGDEGELFSAVLRGVDLNPAQIQQIKQENDSLNFLINSQTILAEQNNPIPPLSVAPLANGISSILSSLQNSIDQGIWATNLPFIGNQLSNITQASKFIDNLKNDLIPKISGANINNISSTFRSLGWNFTPISISQDLVKFEVSITKPVSVFSTPIRGDIGLPGLGFDMTKGDVNVNLTPTLNFGFQVERATDNSTIFSFNPVKGKEVNLGINITIPQATIQGDLGVLQLDITDKKSSVNFGVEIDFDDKNNNKNIDLNELTTQIDGNVNLNLGLKTSIEGSALLPSISSDFNLGWQLIKAQLNNTDKNWFGNTKPNVEFKDIKFNAGEVFTKFATPILTNIQSVTRFLSPWTQALTTEIPTFKDLKEKNGIVLWDANGDTKTNAIDLIQFFLGGTPTADNVIKFINNLSSFNNIANKYLDFIQLDSGDPNNSEDNQLVIDLGSFSLNDIGDFDVQNKNANLKNADLSSLTPEVTNSKFDLEKITVALDTGNPVDGYGINTGDFKKEWSDYLGSFKKIDFRFPILEKPTSILGLFLGKDNVDLITYDMPDFNAEFGVERFFPLAGPIGATLKGDIKISSDFSFGFDTYGLSQAAKNNNPLDVLKGFYVVDKQPELKTDIDIRAFGALEGGVARGGVGGGIYADLKLDLVDSDGDGKVRGFDINPVVGGTFSTGLESYAEVGFPDKSWAGVPLGQRWTWESPKYTLFEFDTKLVSPQFAPKLATLLSDGTLRLNSGLNALGRQVFNTKDGYESIKIEGVINTFAPKSLVAFSNVGLARLQPLSLANSTSVFNGSSVQISAFGFTQEFANFNRISISGGNGNTDLDVVDTFTPIDYLGGEGDDSIRSGDGDDILIGGAGWDRIFGGFGADRISGGSGDDMLYGGYGSDIVDGGTENDIIYGGAGDDVVYGNFGSDSLYGDEGSDQMDGNDGDDLLDGGDGNDVLSGGQGSDLLYGQQGADTISGDADNDRISGGDNNDLISGGNGDDTIAGDTGDDIISGGNDNDLISGGDDNDTITGDEGDDNIFGDNGADNIQGNTGNDTISGGNDNDLISGGDDNDIITGDAGDDTIFGDNGADFIQGNDGNDTISGGNDNDRIEGNQGNDQINGDAGDDLIAGNDGSDRIFGGSGNDTITGDAGNDLINGNDGNDLINGNDGDDTIFGDAGSDNIYGDAGNDNISGGNDNDSIFGGNGNDNIQGDAGDDTIFGSDGNDSIQGNDGNDTIFGENGQDLITGNNGDDTIFGGNDKDNIFGDDGNDTIKGDNGDDNIYGGNGNDNIQGNDGNDKLYGDAGNDLMEGNNGDDFLAGGADNDTMKGGDGADFLNGQAGNDTLYGDAGNDILYGEDGDDKLYGGDGDDYMVGGYGGDLLDGGSGLDMISYYTSQEGVTVQLSSGHNKGGEAQGDKVTNVENLEGSFHDDWLIGDNDNNVIIGLSGNDKLEGKVGADSLYGGTGDDFLDGGEGNDILLGGDSNDNLDGSSGDDIIGGGAGDDVVFGGRSGDDILSGGDGNDTIDGSSGDDLIFGGNGNDIIDAGSHNDLVNGGDGDDLIYGGSGDDVLLGGAGNDTIYADTGNDILVGGLGDDILYGSKNNGQRSTTFGLALNNGTDTIFNFQTDKDIIGLLGGLTANQITLIKSAQDTILNAQGQTLAILKGVQFAGKQTPTFALLNALPTALEIDPVLALKEPTPPPALSGSAIFPGVDYQIPNPTMPAIEIPLDYGSGVNDSGNTGSPSSNDLLGGFGQDLLVGSPISLEDLTGSSTDRLPPQYNPSSVFNETNVPSGNLGNTSNQNNGGGNLNTNPDASFNGNGNSGNDLGMNGGTNNGQGGSNASDNAIARLNEIFGSETAQLGLPNLSFGNLFGSGI